MLTTYSMNLLAVLWNLALINNLCDKQREGYVTFIFFALALASTVTVLTMTTSV
jgi:hypothetical protein